MRLHQCRAQLTRFSAAPPGAIERLEIGGLPFGLPQLADSEIAYGAGRVQLEPGDLLFIFTDGVVEAVNDRGEEFGEPRLVPAILSVPAGVPPRKH